jgi:hypothetical protein
MARTRGIRRAVSSRTMKRRAEKVAAAAEQRARSAQRGPETMTQAKVWDRKKRRYLNAGLCFHCAAQAAWGHEIGFGKIADPCPQCQPIVDLFETPGPSGSKWRKCLLHLESLTRAEVAEILGEVFA